MRNQIKLRKGQFLRVGLEGGRVVAGLAWVTLAGNAEDFILRDGENIPCCHPDILLEALSEELAIETQFTECLSLGA